MTGKSWKLIFFSALMMLSLLFLGCENGNPVSVGGDAGYADGMIYDKSDADNNGSTGRMNYNGYTYSVVRIGALWWMAENLRTTRYNDGTTIPNIQNNIEWVNLTEEETGAWCDYDNNPSIGDVYGKLYNWFAVATGRLAPPGWRVPSDDDWKQLEMFLGLSQAEADEYGLFRGADDNIGGKLKETGGQHWSDPNEGATNESGFAALPGGYRSWNNGICRAIGGACEFWTSSGYEETDSPVFSGFPAGHPQDGRYYAWRRYLGFAYGTISRTISEKTHGYSVRCVQD